MRIAAGKAAANQMIDDFGHGGLGYAGASGQFADLVFSILDCQQNPELSKVSSFTSG